MCHYTTVFFTFGTLRNSWQVYWKIWLRFDFAYHMASMSLHRAWRYRKFFYWLVLRKILSDISGSHLKKLLDLSFLYNTNFVSIIGKIYWPYQMFADLIAGPIEFLWTLHVGLSFGVIMLSIEYYNRNVVKYVEIIDPMMKNNVMPCCVIFSLLFQSLSLTHFIYL